MPSETVLVTDGEQRAALAVARSLGRAGYRVEVVSSRRRSLAGVSRLVRAAHVAPSPAEDPAGYVERVGEVARTLGARVLLPITDQSLLALLPARERWPDLVVPFVGIAAYRRLADKEAVTAAARAEGIAVPSQHVLVGAGDPSPGDLSYPVVIKPARSVVEDGGGLAKVGIRYAENPGQLTKRLAALPAAAFPVLLQERIGGPGIGVFVLLRAGELVAYFGHRRLREKPPSGGVSVYCESVAVEPALLDASVRLLSRFQWEGVAMVEYKLDAASGRPVLMECNGRFWGSLQLAVDAGVDFPRLLVAGALGEPLPVQPGYAVGVRSRWWLGDLDHLYARLRHPAERLALPSGAPSRGRAMREFLRLRRGDRSEVQRREDPLPGLWELWEWVRGR